MPAHRDFIRDQRQEVIRFLTGLPPRHPFRDKSDYDQAKDDAERVEKDVELQRYAVERLRTAAPLSMTRNHALSNDKQHSRRN